MNLRKDNWKWSKIKEARSFNEYRCKCGHTLYIPREEEKRICIYCGRAVSKKNNKSVYELKYIEWLKNSYKRFMEARNEKEI